MRTGRRNFLKRCAAALLLPSTVASVSNIDKSHPAQEFFIILDGGQGRRTGYVGTAAECSAFLHSAGLYSENWNWSTDTQYSKTKTFTATKGRELLRLKVIPWSRTLDLKISSRTCNCGRIT